ncbi:MAG TPA: bifunctional glutamate N-acetyltransferase/amino-acid acetyltransferase ArgJ [Caulobacteraceae bacterium]
MKPPARRGRIRERLAAAAHPVEVVGQTIERTLDPLTAVLKRAALRRAERDSRQFEEPAPEPVAPPAPRSRVSPLAVPFPEMPPTPGVELASAYAGLRRRQKDDVVLMRFAPGTACAGVFTRHAVAAAPVEWCRRHLEASGGEVRALVVNAGCANSMAGKAGTDAARRVAAAAAKRLGVRQREVMLASTGPMGGALDDAKLTGKLPQLEQRLAPASWEDAARAIMSTDTFPKGACATAEVEGRTVRIAGIAKGSGMVAPDMATVLAFIATDAAINASALQTLAGLYVRSTFNSVTVDGDASTNDCCLLFATGASGAPKITRAGDKRLVDFREKLEQVMFELALQVVRDGEGASKLIKVGVTGAANPASARKIARAIATSVGVRAALSGGEPNWSRVVAAAGQADEPLRREHLSLRFGGVTVLAEGAITGGYVDEALRDYLGGREIEVGLDAGVGPSRAVVWTCDLTPRYVELNQGMRG